MARGEGQLNWKQSRFWIVIVAMAGVLIGSSIYTFAYAKGFSYMSEDPQVCTNCHVMQQYYDAWLAGPHHQNATCNDCHLPYKQPMRYMTKAENGYHHSKAFTLQNFHEPILPRDVSKQVVQDNCVRCHFDFTHDMAAVKPLVEGDVGCVHCHRSAGHAAR